MSVEIENDRTAETISAYIAGQCSILGENPKLRLDSVDTVQEDGSRLRLGIGVGTTHFEWNGHQMSLNRHREGPPVTSRTCARDAVVYQSVTLIGPDPHTVFQFCKAAVDFEDAETNDDWFRTFTWDAQGDYWKRQASIAKRDWNSVVIDKVLEEKLQADLTDFFSAETRDWYSKHGIPYRRGYLFHGPPGTGKTSMISVMASKYGRHVYRLNLVAPRLCDNSLHNAISSVRDKAIIVMEDVDCLFGKMREKKEEFCVTFSGLLNAIDGLQPAKGSVFVFTSNHPEKLDRALKRKGRIDLELKFSHCNKEQLKRMFLNFYDAPDLADAFVQNVARFMPVTPAELQEHFISCRQKSADEACKNIIIERDKIDDVMSSMWN
ncbi:MAG: hypothetical protein CBC12_07605 [Candidatus Puniceispirillum sp. TMED52]|jgi:hypothetical protein|nr:MAG: hypothetical protein CBC12_07605 [Candidatus Puniceispirillum sp. TMED52]RPF82054.1 MAG: AAA family ATPase [Rhodothermaceae bacterium TMED105]|tara:strand:- start:3830 stop:4966 length:1137 start_codon:yes stop_codon:yes gene_type:complete